jgi:EmrB/QacA subfamily drug resistance transporter
MPGITDARDPGPPVPTRPGGPGLARRGTALALLVITQFVLVLDAAIVNVALPSIGRGLSVRPAELSWVVNAYVLLFGGFLMLGGRIADLAGRRRTFVAGIALFTAASLAAATARSGTWLVIARGAQGMGAAFVSPAALALVMTLYPAEAERSRALRAWAGAASTGGVAGAVLGGLLTEGFGWPAVFLVNVPIGLLALLLSRYLLPGDRDSSSRGTGPVRRPAARQPADVAGAVTVTISLTLLVYAFIGADTAGWSSVQTLALLASSLVMLLAFVAIEASSKRPLVPLRVFRNQALRGSDAVAFVNTAAVFPMFFFVTLYTQRVLGYSALQAGLAQLPIGISMVCAATLAPRVVARIGYKHTLVAGMTLIAGGMFWFTAIRPAGSYVTNLLGPSLLVGTGNGLTWVASMVGATTGTDERESGLASALINTAQQLGGALGVAVLVAVAAARTTAMTTTGRITSPAALTAGFGTGFAGAAITAGAGAILAWLLLSSAASRRHAAMIRAGNKAPDPGPGQRTAAPVEEEAHGSPRT